MKVLMTADPIGGVWRYALELCEALHPYGVRVLLAVLGGDLNEAQRAEVSRLRNVTVHQGRYRLEWMDSPWESLEAAGAWLQALEREFEPDLIHLNHLVHGDLLWRAPVLIVAHSCVLSWFRAVHGHVPPEWARYREAVTRSLHAAKLVVAPTRDMMRSLHVNYGVLVRNQVIANGLDPQRFQVLPKENVILSAGRLWDEAKNVAALCAVADAAPWPIFVAGATTSPDGRSHSVAGGRPLGALSATALSAWYSSAAIYALPARYEPFGLTPLEAAFSGCALVLGDIESLREVWDEAACYVSPDDTAALRATLNRLIADQDELKRFSTLARARASRYTAEAMASSYWNAYWSLMNGKESSACASYSSITH